MRVGQKCALFQEQPRKCHSDACLISKIETFNCLICAIIFRWLSWIRLRDGLRTHSDLSAPSTYIHVKPLSVNTVILQTPSRYSRTNSKCSHVVDGETPSQQWPKKANQPVGVSILFEKPNLGAELFTGSRIKIGNHWQDEQSAALAKPTTLDER